MAAARRAGVTGAILHRAGITNKDIEAANQWNAAKKRFDQDRADTRDLATLGFTTAEIKVMQRRERAERLVEPYRVRGTDGFRLDRAVQALGEQPLRDAGFSAKDIREAKARAEAATTRIREARRLPAILEQQRPKGAKRLLELEKDPVSKPGRVQTIVGKALVLSIPIAGTVILTTDLVSTVRREGATGKEIAWASGWAAFSAVTDLFLIGGILRAGKGSAAAAAASRAKVEGVPQGIITSPRVEGAAIHAQGYQYGALRARVLQMRQATLSDPGSRLAKVNPLEWAAQQREIQKATSAMNKAKARVTKTAEDILLKADLLGAKRAEVGAADLLGITPKRGVAAYIRELDQMASALARTAQAPKSYRQAISRAVAARARALRTPTPERRVAYAKAREEMMRFAMPRSEWLRGRRAVLRQNIAWIERGGRGFDPRRGVVFPHNKIKDALAELSRVESEMTGILREMRPFMGDQPGIFGRSTVQAPPKAPPAAQVKVVGPTTAAAQRTAIAAAAAKSAAQVVRLLGPATVIQPARKTAAPAPSPAAAAKPKTRGEVSPKPQPEPRQPMRRPAPAAAPGKLAPGAAPQPEPRQPMRRSVPTPEPGELAPGVAPQPEPGTTTRQRPKVTPGTAPAPSARITSDPAPTPDVDPKTEPKPKPTQPTRPTNDAPPRPPDNPPVRRPARKPPAAPLFRLPDGTRMARGVYPERAGFKMGWAEWAYNFVTGKSAVKVTEEPGSPAETFRVRSTTTQRPKTRRKNLGIVDMFINSTGVTFVPDSKRDHAEFRDRRFRRRKL